MTLAALPNGTSVFIDANILVYCFGNHPQFGDSCKQLLQRIARQEVHGYTTVHALGDIAHRLMTMEAIDQFGWPAKGIAQRLRQRPADVQKLTRFLQAVVDIPQTHGLPLPIIYWFVKSQLPGGT